MPVKDSNQFQAIAPDSIRDDIGRIGNYEFPGSGHPAWPPHAGWGLEKIDCIENPPGYERRVLLGILRDDFP